MNTQPKKGQIFVYFNTTASLAQAENYYFILLQYILIILFQL